MNKCLQSPWTLVSNCSKVSIKLKQHVEVKILVRQTKAPAAAEVFCLICHRTSGPQDGHVLKMSPRACLKGQNWGQHANTALTSWAKNRQGSVQQPHDSPVGGMLIQDCIMGSFPGSVMSFLEETTYFHL